jgi:NAD(P)-dependent dehydrogenase (short-subunit alcohol dehydrogenase family)
MEQPGTVLVTGAVSGIGRAVAVALGADGWDVVVHGLDAEARRTADEIGALGAVTGDLRDPDVPARLIAEVLALGRGLRGLVNNAADTSRSDLDGTDAATFDRFMAVNVRAPLLLIRAARPHFRAAGGGAVVNVGSVNAHCGQEDLLAYSMSKGAMTTMTRNLSDALGSERIRVNQVNPGWVLTEGEYALRVREGFPADWPSRLPAATVPSGRLIAPEEIAEIVALFMSGRIGPISGTVLDAHQYPVIGRSAPKVTT